jgi:hypothetical protein
MEPNHQSVWSITLFQIKLRSFSLIYEVRIEYIEFVTLYYLWWRVISIIVSLVVLVPLIPCLNSVEVFGFPRLIHILPIICLYEN